VYLLNFDLVDIFVFMTTIGFLGEGSLSGEEKLRRFREKALNNCNGDAVDIYISRLLQGKSDRMAKLLVCCALFI
jgi:hypothetical protein